MRRIRISPKSDDRRNYSKIDKLLKMVEKITNKSKEDIST
jgi:hypothetical protein